MIIFRFTPGELAMSTHQKIETSNAPQALGPYSQAVKAGNLVFVSGQLPFDISTGKLIEGTIPEMTLKVIDHLEAILKSSGSSLDKVVRCDVFLTDLKNFKEMNEAYATRFNSSIPPARQTIQVSALPLNSPIEISCIGLI